MTMGENEDEDERERDGTPRLLAILAHDRRPRLRARETHFSYVSFLLPRSGRYPFWRFFAAAAAVVLSAEVEVRRIKLYIITPK